MRSVKVSPQEGETSFYQPDTTDSVVFEPTFNGFRTMRGARSRLLGRTH